MPIKNCPICSKIFDDMGIQEVCASCFAENEREISLVKEYLYQHPNTGIVEVSEATGVSIEKLKRFLKNDRLVAVNYKDTPLL